VKQALTALAALSVRGLPLAVRGAQTRDDFEVVSGHLTLVGSSD
jgi:hypothetical protein